MSHDMFGEVVRRSVRVGSRAWYTVPLSILAHVGIAAVFIVVPLMATDVLPKPTSIHPAFVTTPPPPPPPPPVARASKPNEAQPPAKSDIAPINAPDKVVDETSPPPLPNAATGIEGGLPPGLVGDTGISLGPVVVPPPPPAPVPSKPLPVGGDIAVPKKVRDVRPVYPKIAQDAKVSGTVMIEATIGVDGRVKNARVIKSIALLDQAALDAVRQWQFSPSRLNGVPIPVIMTVTINFFLQ